MVPMVGAAVLIFGYLGCVLFESHVRYDSHGTPLEVYEMSDEWQQTVGQQELLRDGDGVNVGIASGETARQKNRVARPGRAARSR